MGYPFSEEEERWRKTVNDFVDQELGREYYRKHEKEKLWPQEAYDKAAQRGWLGLIIPKEYGGMGCSYRMHGILLEAMGKYSYNVAHVFHASVMAQRIVMAHGSKELKDFYLPKVAKGERRFSIAQTEPDAGSDAAGITTSAVIDGNDFVINGRKIFSAGSFAPQTVIFMTVRTDKDVPKHKGVSTILVPNTTPGLEIIPQDLIVHRAVQADFIRINNVRVPKTNLVGILNQGWQCVVEIGQNDRLGTSWITTGMGQQAVNDAISYAKQRVQFGQPIVKFQVIRHMLADMQTDIDACRLMAYRASWLVDNGLPYHKETSMAKLFCTETVFRVVDKVMQIFGGYSFDREMDVSRYWIDTRMMRIGGGTSQIQRVVIAREMEL